MYGVKLVSYDRKKPSGSWVTNDHGKRFETNSLQEAMNVLTEYSDQHPKGCFMIVSIEDEQNVN